MSFSCALDICLSVGQQYSVCFSDGNKGVLHFVLGRATKHFSQDSIGRDILKLWRLKDNLVSRPDCNNIPCLSVLS